MLLNLRRKFIQSGRASAIGFLCLAASGIFHPQKAQAILTFTVPPAGLAFAIVAGATLGTGVLFELAAIPTRSSQLAWAGLVFGLIGIIFLDDGGQGGSARLLTSEDAHRYGMTENELLAYNRAVEDKEIDAVLQSAAHQMEPSVSALDRNKEKMKEILSVLDTDAQSAFEKMSTFIVKNHSKM